MGINSTSCFLALGIFLVFFLHNIFYTISAKVFKIRVELFEIFTSVSSNSLFQFKKNHTTYKLGYLPIASSVAISGISREQLDFKNLTTEPYMYIAKPFPSRLMFRLLPLILLSVLCLISVIFINIENEFTTNFKTIFIILENLFNFLIGIDDTTNAMKNWDLIFTKNNITPISIIIMSIYISMYAIILLIIHFITGKTTSILYAITNVILFIITIWFTYKMISLFIAFHSFQEILVSIGIFLITIYGLGYCSLLLLKVVLTKLQS